MYTDYISYTFNKFLSTFKLSNVIKFKKLCFFLRGKTEHSTHYIVELNEPYIICFSFIRFIQDYLNRQAQPQLGHGFRRGEVIFLILLEPYEYS